jgi:hypothetical protein
MSVTPTLIRNFTAGTGGVRYARLVRLGTADGQVVEATAATDVILGVSVQPGTAADGQRCDVALAGVAEVVAGGTISRGAWVTATTGGAAVAAAPAAGTNNNVLGIALTDAVSGDIIPVLLAQHRLQG